MSSAWFGPQTNQCRQTRPFTGPWESCDSIRQEHALALVARPIRGAQHFQNSRCRRGSLASGDAVKIDRAAKLEPVDRGLLQSVGTGNAARGKRDAEIRFEQRDQIPFRAQLVSLVNVETMAANEGGEPGEVLAIDAPQPQILTQFIDLYDANRYR